MKIVSAAILIKDHRLFISQRPAGKPQAHLWELPGGKQECGETIEQCLAREIKEELNAEVIVGNHFMTSVYEYENGAIELQAFFCTLKPGSDLQVLEHEACAWVSPQQLQDYTFAPADRPIVEQLKTLTF